MLKWTTAHSTNNKKYHQTQKAFQRTNTEDAGQLPTFYLCSQWFLNPGTHKDTHLIAQPGGPLQESLSSTLIDNKSPCFRWHRWNKGQRGGLWRGAWMWQLQGLRSWQQLLQMVEGLSVLLGWWQIIVGTGLQLLSEPQDGPLSQNQAGHTF